MNTRREAGSIRSIASLCRRASSFLVWKLLLAAGGLLLAGGVAASAETAAPSAKPAPSAAEMTVPPTLARDSFRNDAGYSLRVDFDGDGVVLKRTSPELPARGVRVMPAYLGRSIPLFRIGFGAAGARKIGIRRTAWDHQTAEYRLPRRGIARVVLSRLSPAVLVDSPGKEFDIRGGVDGTAPAHVAFVCGGKVVTRRTDEPARPAADWKPDEPWLLGWFGKASPYRGYRDPIDLDPPHEGAGFARKPPPPVALDLPMLFRLEHRPSAVERLGDGLRLRFTEKVGKIAVMPLFGGRLFDPETTEAWAAGLPDEVVAQCRLWAKNLRDYPLAVTETFDADPRRDVLTVRQTFRWISFADDWNWPPVHAAPVPPMLALALGGGVPVTFHVDGRQVVPDDYRLMDTPGKAMGIAAADGYEYRITGLGKHLGSEGRLDRKAASPGTPDRKDNVRPATGGSVQLRAKLQRHVAEMLDAGHLAPLFYIYGGIGGPRPGYFYWAGSPELARTLAMAYPYLSGELQDRVKAYLKREWRINPPLEFDPAKYHDGANRAPYEVPWDDIGRDATPVFSRERKLREAHYFADLYGIDAYYQLTGEPPDPALKDRIVQMAGRLLARQDWALASPVREHGAGLEFLTGGSYYERNGQAATNARLAGAAGMVRLARRATWPDLERLGWYLFGKLAVARVGQARYTAEMHRMGLVRGAPEDDWRTLVHIDRCSAIVLRGNIKPVVFEDQELPPFVDLVEPVGRLLGDYARAECRIYLDHLDRSMPLWYISEAPKQSASEQRLCPLQYKNGNVLAQNWILGKRGERFLRYVDTTRFQGDLYYLQNLAAALSVSR